MRGLVKIGQTTRDSETRADELFSGSSGVADRFEVVYDAVVSDIDAAEEQIHKELQATRFNESREFFRVKIKDAVKLVQRVASTFEVDEDLEANEIEILPRLEERMRRWLRRELVSVKFVQFPDLCILRVTEQPDLTKIEARQTAIDLRVLGDPDADDDLMFSPTRSIKHNVSILLNELDAYSMIMVGLKLISDEAADYIAFLVEEAHIEPPIEPGWRMSSIDYDMWASRDDETTKILALLKEEDARRFGDRKS